MPQGRMRRRNPESWKPGLISKGEAPSAEFSDVENVRDPWPNSWGGLSTVSGSWAHSTVDNQSCSCLRGTHTQWQRQQANRELQCHLLRAVMRSVLCPVSGGWVWWPVRPPWPGVESVACVSVTAHPLISQGICGWYECDSSSLRLNFLVYGKKKYDGNNYLCFLGLWWGLNMLKHVIWLTCRKAVINNHQASVVLHLCQMLLCPS